MNINFQNKKPIKGNSKTRGFLLGTIHIPTLLFGFIVAGTFYTILNSNSGSVPPTTKKEVGSIVDPVPNVRGGGLQGEQKNVGSKGGAWTAETHLSHYGFNVDWGLLEVLESSCRDFENSRIPNGEDKWTQNTYSDNPHHPLNGYWKGPRKQFIDCKVLEVGCGVGVYVDALKKEMAKRRRTVIGIEPNPMGGTFNRGVAGPKQLPINFLAADDQVALAKQIRNDELGGDAFDFIYSIEVFEHMPLDRHDDAVKFLAASARQGTKLLFGAATPGQAGVGHIGCRKQKEWIEIMARHNFIKHDEDTAKATRMMQEYNHRVNTVVYYYQGE
jgi:SAM-dependent methyltransferase